jgi:hypothetical protein
MTILFGFSGTGTMGMPWKVVMVGGTSAEDEGGGIVVAMTGGSATAVTLAGGIDAGLVGTTFKFKELFCGSGFDVVALGAEHPKTIMLSMRLVTISRGILLIFISTSGIVLVFNKIIYSIE